MPGVKKLLAVPTIAGTMPATFSSKKDACWYSQDRHISAAMSVTPLLSKSVRVTKNTYQHFIRTVKTLKRTEQLVPSKRMKHHVSVYEKVWEKLQAWAKNLIKSHARKYSASWKPNLWSFLVGKSKLWLITSPPGSADSPFLKESLPPTWHPAGLHLCN